MKRAINSLHETASPIVGLALAAVAFALMPAVVLAQTVTPESINIDDASPVCNDDSITEEVCIELPPDSVSDNVDVFFLFDDTGSFAGFVPTVADIFQDIVTGLQTALPAVDFGFGVGRFEDYGGPGSGFSGEVADGRPFILNQPIVTESDAVDGGTTLNDLIVAALGRTAPGFGGDGPESAIAEGLFQLATGIGFDGDGDGSNTGSGAAGAVSTQTTPGTSGDVPAFSTLDPTVISSGSVGGAGYRDAALRLVILATDICSIAAFSADEPIPATIVGSGSEEPTSVYACASTVPGVGRFGFVSDSKTSAGNTVVGAVAPAGAGTVPDTIPALNAAGIRVLGLAPGGFPTDDPGPSGNPSVFLSALARTTGAVDGVGDPLVFNIGSGGDPLLAAIIVAAIEETVTLPIDINLMASEPLPGGAGTTMVGVTPSVVSDVAPGEMACFDATITGTDSPMGDFELRFKDDASGAVLGTIPVGLECIEGMASSSGKVTGGGGLDLDDGAVTFGTVAMSDEEGTRGNLQVNDHRTKDRFHGSTVDILFVLDNVASWAGEGRWNGEDGYRFEVTVVDNRNGNSKKKGIPDTIDITVKDASDVVIWSTGGPVDLNKGNIKVH